MIGRIQLEPEAQAFVEAEALPPVLFTLGIEKGRAALEEAQADPESTPPVDMEDLTIADGPSEQVTLRILRPEHAQAPLPVIVYIHGAGWVFGSK
jgi:acetyl esterase